MARLAEWERALRLRPKEVQLDRAYREIIEVLQARKPIVPVNSIRQNDCTIGLRDVIDILHSTLGNFLSGSLG